MHSTYLPVWFWVLGSHQERCTQDRRPRPMVSAKAVRNQMVPSQVRWTTRQPRLSAIVQARHLSLFGHIARMPDETDPRSIITASPLEDWRRPPGRPRTTWMKTIQQDLRSNNLSLDEAITVAQNRPLWETDVCVWRYAPLVVHATQEEEEDSCGCQLSSDKYEWMNEWMNEWMSYNAGKCWLQIFHDLQLSFMQFTFMKRFLNLSANSVQDKQTLATD